MKRRNYDLLREPTQTPRILVLMHLPKDEADWLTVTTEQLILRRCAYWVSLAVSPETDNKESVAISVPKENRFDVDRLNTLMDQSRTGAIT